jgi:hypothetical protein
VVCEIASVPATQVKAPVTVRLPLPPRVPAERARREKVTGSLNNVVPLAMLTGPLRLNCTGVRSFVPRTTLTVRPPGPLRAAPVDQVKAFWRFSVDPEAMATGPLTIPGLLTVILPLCTLTVPLSLNATLLLRVKE